MSMTAEETLVEIEKLAMYYLEQPKYKCADESFMEGYSLGYFRGECKVAELIMVILDKQ